MTEQSNARPSISPAVLPNKVAKSGRRTFNYMAFFLVFLTGLMLAYGTLDMPAFSDPNAPTNLHVVPRYIQKGMEETGVVNLVTAILASYRGYDTLGETIVILTAGISVILLLRRDEQK